MTNFAKTALLLTLLFAGCGEINYKRGANGDDLAADQQRCRTAGGDFDSCMTTRGWTTYRPGGMVIDDGGSAAPTGSDEMKPQNPSAPAPAGQADDLLLSARTSKDNRGATPDDAPRPKPAARSFDPLAVYSVSSWWKRGGGREDLESSAAACSAKLGEPHKLIPREGGGHRATALLIRCLKDYGWYGLGVP